MPARPTEVVRFLARHSKLVAVSVVGGVFVVAGVAMLVLPGPGILVVAVGFAILGTEYAWAATALERTKRTAEGAARVTRRGLSAVGGRVIGRRRSSTQVGRASDGESR